MSFQFLSFIGGADELLQNFFTHIRQIPHFDTRFGGAQARFRPPQKRPFCKCPGKCVAAFLFSRQMCIAGRFLGSKRVSKWGNFLISIKSFCKQVWGRAFWLHNERAATPKQSHKNHSCARSTCAYHMIIRNFVSFIT